MTALELLLELSNNLAYLLALTFIYGLLSPFLSRYSSLVQSLIRGVLFGLFGIAVMLNAIQLVPGYFLDSRSIVILIAGMFGGPIPATITAFMIFVYRVILGGGGVLPSLFSALTCLLLGIWVYRRRRSGAIKLTLPILLFLGIALVFQREFWTSLFTGTVRLEFFHPTLIPILIIYPIGTALLGLLLLRQERHEQVEDALQESEERYRLIVNSMNDGIAILDSRGVIISCNPSAERILGLKTNQLIGKSLFDSYWEAFHDDGSAFISDTYPGLITLHTGVTQSKIVLGVKKPDQSIAWIELSTTPLRLSEQSGSPAVLATFTDITERRESQTKLRQERDLLRTLIDSSPDYIFIKDTEGRFILSNLAHAQAGKLDPVDLVGKTAFDVFPADLATQYHADDQQIMASGQPLLNIERTTLDAAGQSRVVLTSKIPLLDRDGEKVGLIGISRDITDRKQLEVQSLELVSERQRTNILQRFISDMSHDFRTPLSIINSSLHLIKKNTDPEKQRAHLEKLEQQVLRLNKLLDNVLQMSNLDRRSVMFQFVTTDLNSLIEKAIQNLEPTFGAAQLEITFFPETSPCLAAVDSVELTRALINLLENAISYTKPPGKISLRTRVQDDAAIISVQDTGIGIAAGDLPHIFERFYRGDQARSISTGDNGLGLSIAQTIIQAHGGTIQVESLVGRGSTFTIKLPVRHDVEVNHAD
jgi:PAS domain S-box-containing protein